MSERYKKIYELPRNLYSTGSPIIISAGALLQDNQLNKVLVQLKIKNISDSIIKGVKLEVICQDIANRTIDNKKVYQYLDLEVCRGKEFGQKTPIYLEDDTTRAYSVNIIEVVLSDNQIWNNADAEFEPLKAIEELNFNNNELLKQYKMKYGEKSKFVFFEEKDLWVCSCGEINTQTDQQCRVCSVQYNNMKSYNVSKLEEDMNKRLENEKEEREEKEKARKKEKEDELKRKRNKQTMNATKVLVFGVIICAIGQFIASTTIYEQFLINQGGEKAVKGLSLLDFKAEYTDNQVIITKFYSEDKSDVIDIVIPNGVDKIYNSAFSDFISLKTITIPNSVISIGSSAFSGCTSLEEITIPYSVTSIGNSAFMNCTSLEEITIPNTVTSIGKFPFALCDSLKTITVDNKEGAFENLTNDTIPSNAKIVWLR